MILDNSVRNNCYFYNPFKDKQTALLYYIFFSIFFKVNISKINFWNVSPGFPGGSYCKESACNAGDPGSIPGLGISPGEGNGNPL